MVLDSLEEAQGARIIVVDPCPSVRRKRVAALAHLLWPATEAQTGWELLWTLAEGRPYLLVVTSTELPGISGVEVLKMVRAAGLPTPFVLVGRVRDRQRIRRLVPVSIIEDTLLCGGRLVGPWVEGHGGIESSVVSVNGYPS